MNKVTKDIMALLNVDADTAMRVQIAMECDGFDFSECSQRTFRKEVLSTFNNLSN